MSHFQFLEEKEFQVGNAFFHFYVIQPFLYPLSFIHANKCNFLTGQKFVQYFLPCQKERILRPPNLIPNVRSLKPLQVCAFMNISMLFFVLGFNNYSSLRTTRLQPPGGLTHISHDFVPDSEDVGKASNRQGKQQGQNGLVLHKG